MKKTVLAFIAVFSLLILTNCTTRKTGAEQGIAREWMLVEFQDFSKAMMVANTANINFTKMKDSGKFTADMGCNRMFGSAVFSENGTVKFSNVGSTMMFCDNAMDLESAFGKALPTMIQYKIEAQYLILSNRSGKTMKLVASDWD